MFERSEVRRRVADVLINWGYRLDPNRPNIRRDGNGYVIGMGPMPLAKVDIPPGQVITGGQVRTSR